ncbi:MAG: AEC family transporter [Pseudomonadota bacterium]
MGSIINIIAPVFVLIALGYVTARFKFLPDAAGDGLAQFVVKLAVPVLLMRSIATAQLGDVNPWGFLLAYGITVLVAWAMAGAVIVSVFKRGWRASVIAGVAASFSNLVLLGIPLIERAFGEPGLQILFFLISFHLPFMMTLSTFLMEHAVRADGVEQTPLRPLSIAKTLARNLAVNPIIIGIAAGLLWRFSGLPYGGLPGDVIDALARTTGPLALFSLGMGLIKYGIKGNLAPAFALAALSLIVMPGTIYGLGTTVLDLPVLWLQVAVLAAACPTGMNAYLFATYFNIAQGLATNTIVIATLGSIITLPLWLSLVL